MRNRYLVGDVNLPSSKASTRSRLASWLPAFFLFSLTANFAQARTTANSSESSRLAVPDDREKNILGEEFHTATGLLVGCSVVVALPSITLK